MDLDYRDRLIIWFWGKVGPIWPSAVLLLGILYVMITSISQAEWVPDGSPLVSSLALGLLLGCILAISRFGGLFSAIYSLALCLFFVFQVLSALFSNLGAITSQSFLDILQQINLRTFLFAYRVVGWIEAIQNGGRVNDTGIFVLLISLVLWLSGSWLGWWVVRRKKALPGIVPLGFLLTLNVYLTGQESGVLLLFLVLVVLLIGRTAYTSIHQHWNKRKIDYPEDLGLDWGSNAVLVSFVVGGVALVATVVGTPEGWKWLSEVFRPIQQQTSDTADQLFTGVKPPEISDSSGSVAIQMPDLSQIGSPLPLGNQVVMWVQISDPPPPSMDEMEMGIDDRSRIHYWRDSVFRQYTGRGWTGVEPVQRPIPTEFLRDPPEGKYALEQKYEIVASHGSVQFSVNQPVRVSEGASLRFVEPDGNSLVRGIESKYDVISWATLVTSNRLRQPTVELDPAIQAAYLQLPASLPGRVSTLALQVAANDRTAYDKALRIQNFLRQNYEYTLNVPLAPEGRDVVDYFLFDAPGGFCSHYASAMVVMLRVNGVPARIATGYAMGYYDEEREAYRVPLSASHAWVEVYFPGIGWVEFEPTPSQRVIQYPDEYEPVGEWITQDPSAADRPFTLGQGLYGIAIFGGAVLLAYLFYRLSTPKKYDSQTIISQSEGMYRSMRRSMTRLGLPASVSDTPSEYLDMVIPSLERYPLIQAGVRILTELFVAATFRASPPSPLDLKNARYAWERAFWQRITLWLEHTFQVKRITKGKLPSKKIKSNGS